MTDTAQGGPTPENFGGANKNKENLKHSTTGQETAKQASQAGNETGKKDDGLPSHAWKKSKG